MSNQIQEFISSIQNSHYLQTTRNVAKTSFKTKICKFMFNKVGKTNRKPVMVN